jgi:hypothetical protein
MRSGASGRCLIPADFMVNWPAVGHVPQFCESDDISVRRVGCVGQGRLSLRTIIAAMVARPVSARLIRTHFVAGQNA